MLNTQQYPPRCGCCFSGAASGSYKANGLNGCSNAKTSLLYLIAALGVGLALVALFLLTANGAEVGRLRSLQEVILAINIAGGVLLFAC